MPEPNELRLNAGMPIEITAAKEDGKRPSFSMLAYTGVAMQAGGFYSPVIVELSGVRTGKSKTPIFLNHDPSQIVGIGEAKVDGAAIRVEGSITSDDGPGQTVISNAKNGFEWQASIGANITRREFLEAGKRAVVNGREVHGPMVIARESVLQEVSFVPIGADSQTSAAVAASAQGSNAMQFEQWLEAKGFDAAGLNDQSKAFLKAQFDAEQKPPAPKGNGKPDVTANGNQTHESLDAVVASNKAEIARKDELTKLAASFMGDYPSLAEEIEQTVRLAMDDKSITPAKIELELMRATRTSAPMVHARRSGNGQLTDAILEAAICEATGIKDLEKRFNEQTLEAAHKRFRHGIGMQEVLLVGAAQRGVHAHRIGGNLEEVLHAAMPGRAELRASSGFSTLSVPGILSNVANKHSIDAFNAVEDSRQRISAKRSVSDFKAVTGYSLTGDLQYEEVAASGEIKHGSLGETTYTNQAKTYGKMLAITRQDIINDDLGAFAAVPRKLGRGGALAINDRFWYKFLLAQTEGFFASGNLNYDDGTDTALTAAGLTEAARQWDLKTDPDGKPLGATAKFLLVPPGQWEPAMTLMSSTRFNTGGSASTAKVPDNNVWAGMFEVIKSTYLANSTYTGYSALAWYLLCDPNDIPVIETCFLNGKETPVIETAEADFDVLGIKMRAYHDFGVSLQEYRGGMKFKGEA